MTDTKGTPLCEQLRAIVGSAGFLEGEDIERKNFEDWMGARAIRPPLLLRPDSTSQVSQILALCHAEKQPIAPQGGMTGLQVGGISRRDIEAFLQTSFAFSKCRFYSSIS